MKITKQALAVFERFSRAEPKPIESSVAEKRVTARLDITEEGTCPYCYAKMRKSMAGNHSVWLCDKDRHVAPVKTDVPPAV
jgi:hypothetical protein